MRTRHPLEPARHAVILAAGAGSRFKDGRKLLADVGGRPMLAHAVAAACAVRELERIVVVLGAFAEEISPAVAFGRAQAVVCAEWDEGMSTSLRCGVQALGVVQKVVVLLGDAPTVRPEVIQRCLCAPGGSRAVYRGRPGHPVVLGPEQLARLHEIPGDTGARQLLSGGVEIECGDLASGLDVDTAEDLERLARE